jgi:hypothetical protein
MTTSITKPSICGRHSLIGRGLRFILFAIVVTALCFVSYNVGRLWRDWRHAPRGAAVSESPEFAALLGPASFAGQWTFADLNWSLRSQALARTELASKFDAVANSAERVDASQLPDLNQELVELARKLHVEPIIQGENQIYSCDQPNLKGQLVVRNIAGRPKAVSLVAAFPKEGDRWQVFEFAPKAGATIHSDSSTHLVPLPVTARRTGGRFSDEGQLQLELITLESNDEAIVSLWKHNGWDVRPAPFAGPDDFCYLCARGTEVIYAWSANPRGSLRNLMLVRTSAQADVQSQARREANLELHE